MGVSKSKIERIMLTSVNQMPQALDDVNVCTFLSLMVKLNINNTRCLESIMPFCYKVSNVQRAIGMTPLTWPNNFISVLSPYINGEWDSKHTGCASFCSSRGAACAH